MSDVSRENEANLSLWTDEAIWEAFKNGSRQAFNFIYSQYSSELYNYGRQIVNCHEQVKDAIQDMFVGLWQNREHIGKTNAIKYYLLTALRRKIIENEKKYKKAAIRQFRYREEDTPTIVFPFEAHLIDAENSSIRKRNLQEALNSLSQRQKEIIYLLYYQNMSYNAIANLMGINTHSVYTLAWKATEALRKKIQQLSPLLFAIAYLLIMLFLI